jgi:hypothetical protein
MESQIEGKKLSPAWISFIKFCEKLGHGKVERLEISNGVPVLAEIVKEKWKIS